MPTPRVSPLLRKPTHDLAFIDNDGNIVGFNIDGGWDGVQEIQDSPSAVKINPGGNEWGDHDRRHSHVQQDEFLGGRGMEFFSVGQTQFYDSKGAWTMTSEKLMNGMQWFWSEDYRSEDSHVPSKSASNINWHALIGSERSITTLFTSTGVTADKAYIYLRKRGTPGDLTIAIYSDSAGEPNTELKSVTVQAADVDDIYAVWQVADWSSTQALTGSTAYHILVIASADSGGSHWEVAVDEAGSASLTAPEGSSWNWSASSFTMYYRIVGVDVPGYWIYRWMEGALYKFNVRDDGGNSSFYINGDRGIATSATATTIVDSTKSWTTDVWINAWVLITKGTGKGQFRKITDSDGTGLTVATWDITPDGTSEYVIYNTDIWTSISPTGITTVKDFKVINNIGYVAQGSGDALVHFRWNSSTPGYDWADDGTNKADLLLVIQDPSAGPSMVRAENDTVDVSVAKAVAWGSNLSFGTEIPIGDDTYPITAMWEYNKFVFVGKINGPYVLNQGLAEFAGPSLRSLLHPDNCKGTTQHDKFQWVTAGGRTTLRVQGQTVDPMGPNKGAGMPSNRQGGIRAQLSHEHGLMAAIDAGTGGISSVMLREDKLQGWHELFRAWESGQQIRNIYLENNPGVKTRLWISCGGDSIYMDLPRVGESPLRDSTIKYIDEAILETSTHYFGNHELWKYFHELNLITQNLTTGIEIEVRYQLDDAIGTTTWKKFAGKPLTTRSPSDELPINEGEVKHIRFQFIMRTNTATTTPVLLAYVLEGISSVPVKNAIPLRCIISDTDKHENMTAAEKLEWLYDARSKQKPVVMFAQDRLRHRRKVTIDNVKSVTDYVDRGKMGARVSFVVMEA